MLNSTESTNNKYFDTLEILKPYLHFNHSLPFLFVGSGFSRRYLDTPDWKGLLEHFCSEIDPNDPLLYSKYEAKAKIKIFHDNLDSASVNVLNSIIADFIEQDYNLSWYSDPRFESHRQKFQSQVISGISPFRLAISDYFEKVTSQHPRLLQEELDKLASLSHNSIAGIITTNYDTLLESLFDFTTYIGQEELLFSAPQGIAEIYKIHGCATIPQSIVINSEDYKRIDAKSKYLAAKLLTIFVEHPIIFIGYSISDEDIKQILNNISLCLNNEQLNILQSRFIFINRLHEDEPGEYQINTIVHQTISKKSFPMTQIKVRDFGLIYDAIATNRAVYPVKWLRALKENIYELVETTTPSEKIKIMLPFDNLEDFSNIEYVIGVGISKLAESAYSSFSAEEIYMDIIFDNQKWDPDLLLEKTMYSHLARTCGSMPLFKYLSSAKKPIPKNILKYADKYDTYEEFYNKSLRLHQTTSWGASIDEICSNVSYPSNISYIVRLPFKNLDANMLKKYLAEVLSSHPNDICTGASHPHSSDLRRLIKIYDWMRYYKSYKNRTASM